MKKITLFCFLVFMPLLASMPVLARTVSVPEPSILSLMLLAISAIVALKLRNKFKK